MPNGRLDVTRTAGDMVCAGRGLLSTIVNATIVPVVRIPVGAMDMVGGILRGVENSVTRFSDRTIACRRRR